MNRDTMCREFESAVKELFNCSDHSFNRTPEGYYNAVSSRTFRGRAQPGYAPVAMLWDLWQAASSRATAEAPAGDVGATELAKELRGTAFFSTPSFNKLLTDAADELDRLASRPVPQASEQDERAAFEAWYAPQFAGGEVANMPRRSNGEYVRPQAQIAWMAYQAALAAKSEQPQAKTVAVPVEAYLWLMGMGRDSFTEDRRGEFWWRSAFNERAGLDMVAIYEASKARAKTEQPVTAGAAKGGNTSAESGQAGASELSNARTLMTMRPYLDKADGGFICDNHPEEVVKAGQACYAIGRAAGMDDGREAVIEAARKLVKAKGRYHTELNYKALAEAVAAIAAQGTEQQPEKK